MSAPEPKVAPAEATSESLAFSKTVEDPPFRVFGPGATLPLSQSVTPALDTVAVGVTSATLPETGTLEGMGGMARVTARDPRPPESSSPELIAAIERQVGQARDYCTRQARAGVYPAGCPVQYTRERRR